MRYIGVPEHLIGTVDVENRIERRACFPHQSSGGRNIHQRGINLDSGILNPALLDEFPDLEVRSEWARARLRDRADAAIAHEFEEATGAEPFDHPEAVRKAPKTRLGISDRARRLLVTIATSHFSWRRQEVSNPSPKGRGFLKGKSRAYQTAGRNAGSRYRGIDRHLRMSPQSAALRSTAKQSC